MIKIEQELYVSPEVKIVEFKAQAVLCQSGGTDPYSNNEPNDWFK